jgi:hypothetical protein
VHRTEKSGAAKFFDAVKARIASRRTFLERPFANRWLADAVMRRDAVRSDRIAPRTAAR